MATNLYVITNSKFIGKENQKDWDRMVYELNQLQKDVKAKNKNFREFKSWSYDIEEDEDIPFNVSFSGPSYIYPRLYCNIGVLSTIYKYSFLYEIYNADDFLDFLSFRDDLYNIVKIIGGTEVIYLADNACDKLSTYLECMAWENMPYEEIKAKMIEEFGQPVMDYSKLDRGKLNYREINEFFLDDFSDFK